MRTPRLYLSIRCAGLAAVLLAANTAVVADGYPHYGRDWQRGPASTTLGGTLPQGKPMPRPGPYSTLPSPGGRTVIHDFSGRRQATVEAQPGSRPSAVWSTDGRRRYESDADGSLRDAQGRRIEVLRPLPDGDW